jgi:hypothetical protein
MCTPIDRLRFDVRQGKKKNSVKEKKQTASRKKKNSHRPLTSVQVLSRAAAQYLVRDRPRAALIDMSERNAYTANINRVICVYNTVYEHNVNIRCIRQTKINTDEYTKIERYISNLFQAP